MTSTDTDAAIPSFDVVIVGAGVAGCSAAYHLQRHAVHRILVLDAGPAAGEGIAPRQSGSATMAPSVAPCVKMMVQVFAGSCQDMMRHHGPEGATRYLNATREGLVLQKGIAREIWTNGSHEQHLKELGSYYLAYANDEDDLRKEFQTLQELGCSKDMEWCDKDRLSTVAGMSPNFHCGIYFANEAVVDSSFYAKTLLQYTLQRCNGQAQFWPESTVQSVQEDANGVVVTLQSDGKQIRAKQVVMATGALHQDPQLNGLLKPCYSYLVHVPTTGSANSCDYSPNFFTWGFTHDWCFTKGKVRISGEDHFSAYKPPHLQERCARLSHWTLEQYQCNDNNNDAVNANDFPQQYGLYSETPDMAPLLGRLQPNSRVCYLLGCNAWGQAILSYCSSLVPGLMEYTTLTEQQQDCLQLLNIQRFSQLPAVAAAKPE